MNTANLVILTIALTIAVTVGTAQVTVRTEGTAPAVTAPGPVVTVQEYRTRLREAYVSAGLPATVIEQVLPVDIEIYNARLARDMDKVRVLRQRQVEIVTPTYLPKVRTYFVSHPYVVYLGGEPFTVWVEDSDGDIVSVTVYEQQLRAAYVTIGLPETIIVQLIPLDIQIYHAYVIGNVTLVTQLQERQFRLVPAEHVTKVTTYFRERPIKVKAKADVTFVPWQKSSESATGSAGASAAKTEPAQPDQGKIQPAPPVAEKPATGATPTPLVKGAVPATPPAGDSKVIEKKPQEPAPGATAPKVGKRDALLRDGQQQPSPMMEKAPDSDRTKKSEGKPEVEKTERK